MRERAGGCVLCVRDGVLHCVCVCVSCVCTTDAFGPCACTCVRVCVRLYTLCRLCAYPSVLDIERVRASDDTVG